MSAVPTPPTPLPGAAPPATAAPAAAPAAAAVYLAPRDIIDALECVLGVYFSSVRHNLRAAFILCDGLIELICFAKHDPTNLVTTPIGFDVHLKKPLVSLDPTTNALGGRMQKNHYLRNKMHHVNAAATVDTQRCADAILDAVECIEHCFPGSKAALDDRIKVALRVVRLYSASGNGRHRSDFETEMNRHTWRTRDSKPTKSEVVVSPGIRRNWGLVIFDSTADIETLLNRVGVP